MKKLLLVAVAGAILPGMACAQSSVTLYGYLGGGVRWTNGLKGGSSVAFNNNILAGNRFGISGEEDLGGGIKAIFKLENAFNSGTGALKNAGVLFSQAAYVGFNGEYGRLTFGRQVSSNEYFSILIDPLNGQGQTLAVAPNALYYFNYFTYDTRINNTISYLGRVGGLRYGASYSPGGVAGNARAGTNVSFMTLYQWSGGLAGFGYQKQWNAAATQWAETFQGGGSLVFGPARVFLSYADLNVSASAAGAPNRHDQMPGVGIVYLPTPAIQLTAALYYDRATHLANAKQGDGHKLTTYAVAEYYLSKRTEIYAEADFNGLSGAYRSDALNIAALGIRSGTYSTTGFSIGFMSRF
ncbi:MULTISPECIES: porin [unclassified Paraburkholderia]|uniref:porin n=1 Tax=unclassified Paraburkholderia TaxID=2615204 RepID=UPI002AB2F934|nr:MULTISPECIES: porin [unclassified Paraburkholderia]